ncbi:AraC family transcriptional regulator [Sphingobacterium suaedae]
MQKSGIKLIFAEKKRPKKEISDQRMETSVLQLLQAHPDLANRWHLHERLAREMAVFPPQFDFDLRAIENNPFQIQTHVSKRYGCTMQVVELSSPAGIHIMHSQLVADIDGFVEINARTPYVQLYLALEDNRSYYAEGDLLGKLKKGHQQLFLFQETTVTGFWNAFATNRFLEVNLSIDFLRRFCPTSDELWKKVEDMMHRKQAGSLFPAAVAISKAQEEIIQQLLQIERIPEAWRDFYLQSKISELVILAVSQRQLPSEKPAELPAPMIQLMDKAKEILRDNMHCPPKIEDLAMELGTNQSYLKKFFKERHHMTIHAFLTQERMLAAKQLLKENTKNIYEISRFLGYKNPAHFSTCFKKHYGIRPKNAHQL